MALLRNMVTAVSQALERQRPSWMVVGIASRQPASCRQRLAIHATKWQRSKQNRRQRFGKGGAGASEILALLDLMT
jgi:hypothetical protein